MVRLFFLEPSFPPIFFSMAGTTKCLKILHSIIGICRIASDTVYMIYGKVFGRTTLLTFVVISFQNFLSKTTKSSFIEVSISGFFVCLDIFKIFFSSIFLKFFRGHFRSPSLYIHAIKLLSHKGNAIRAIILSPRSGFINFTAIKTFFIVINPYHKNRVSFC